MPLFEAVRRIRTPLLSTYYGWFLLPLLLASLARPFALWDYFTSTGLFHKGRPIEWGTLLSNALHNLLTGQYVIRPTAVFLYDLQTLIFGGEFWLWYLLKWAAFAVSIWLTCDLLHRLGCGWPARAAAAALVLFHPARFTLMLHAPDGWVALGMVAQLWLLALHRFDAARLPRLHLAAWFALALFTIGAKEVAWVFQGALTFFVALRNHRAWLRLLPHALLTAAWIKILSAGSERAKGFTIDAWLPRFKEQILLLAPLSPLHFLQLLFAALAIASFVYLFTRRKTLEAQLTIFCWLTALAMLAFVVIPPLVALRYAIPPLYLLTIVLALTLQWLPRAGHIAAGLLIAVYPLLTAGNIYRQELAYQHQFFQISTALGEMDSKARAGYAIVLTALPGDFQGEAFHTIQRYFFQYGPLWYGLDAARAAIIVSETGWPEQPFTTISLFDPQRLARDGKFDLRRLEAAYALVPGDFGAFGKLAAAYYNFDRAIGRPDTYWYDNGGPEIRTTPHFYLYVASGIKDTSNTPWQFQQMPAGRRPGSF